METSTGLLIVALVAMLLDLVTGIAKGAKNHRLSSAKMREGAWHKGGFVGLIALAELLQIGSTFTDLGITIPAVSAVCVYIIMTEAVSIFENLTELNDAIANSPLGKVLAQYPLQEGFEALDERSEGAPEDFEVEYAKN